ncbi:MAG: hypothetical protein AAB472_02490 [Patescibacteria group bacterium]
MSISFVKILTALGLMAPQQSAFIEKPHSTVTITLPAAIPMVSPITDLRPLDGMKLGKLSALYMGVRGEAPDYAQIDYTENLLHAWKLKLAIDGVSPATQKSYTKIIARYETGNKGRTTLPAFVGTVDQEITRVKYTINFGKLCAKKEISQDGCELLRDISFAITGEDLVAYGMTELLPFQDGKSNVKLLKVLLPSAGSAYLNSLPALGDTRMSCGFYQFTSYAVRHDGERVEGANVVSQFVPSKYQIPGSVVSLIGNDHHRAAYYFAIYNIARWIQVSSASERTELRRLFPTHMGEVTQFMAIAHHLPTPAIAKARNWVEGHGKKSLASYLGPELRLYAKKTKENKKALHKALRG